MESFWELCPGILPELTHLSHLLILGNTFDFIWCFYFCTSLCGHGPTTSQGRTSVPSIIPAVESNSSCLLPSCLPRVPRSLTVFLGYGSQHKSFKCISLENRHIAFSYMTVIPRRGRGAKYFSRTHFGEQETPSRGCTLILLPAHRLHINLIRKKDKYQSGGYSICGLTQCEVYLAA